MSNPSHFFYVLYCQDDTLYGGYTTDLTRRLTAHNQGVGAKYTRPQSRRPAQLIYAERWSDKRRAMQAEYRFKQLSRPDKELYLHENGQVNVSLNASFVLNIVSDDPEKGALDHE